MKHIRLLIAVTVLLAGISALGSIFISSDATRADAAAFHSLFALSIAVTILHTGAAAGFLYGLKNFKASLRVAYTLMCTGFVFLGLTFFQTPLLSLYDMWDSPYVEFGGVLLPLLLAAFCLYLGARSFARLLGVKNAATSFWLVTLGATVFACIMLVLPHPYTGVPAAEARSSAAFSAVLTIYLAGAAWTVYSALQKVGAQLKEATKWLFVTLVIGAIAGLQHAILGLFLPHEHWYQTYGVSIILHVIDGVIALKAAYLFNQASEDDTVVAEPEPGRAVTEASPIDVITYVASLASTPSDLDPILDDVRLITAGLQDRDHLAPDVQQKLGEVYRNLEQYLVTGERLRKFTQEDVRTKVRSRFARSEQNAAFWQAAGL